jgi:chemotaxis protein CheD
VGSEEQVLHALLGSCVGVGILWPERNLYGLAHCLLPKCSDNTFEKGGRYVDQAIHSLMKMMSITKDDCKKVRAIIAGGGNMTRPIDADPDSLVGNLNVRSAIETLSEFKIKIIHEDTGGTNGRRVSISCIDGKFDVRKIPRPIAA